MPADRARTRNACLPAGRGAAKNENDPTTSPSACFSSDQNLYLGMPQIIAQKAPNRSTEDYIKGIYHLQVDRDNVPTSVLAKHLRIADGSVTDMLKKLSGKNLINYEPYRGVNLTPAGRKLALTLLRRHRLWEMFLVEFLSYTWDEVHDEAEKFEHVISEELERRLDKVLGYPKVDPHGDPIPTEEGNLHVQSTAALGDCHHDGRRYSARSAHAYGRRRQ